MIAKTAVALATKNLRDHGAAKAGWGLDAACVASGPAHRKAAADGRATAQRSGFAGVVLGVFVLGSGVFRFRG